jgi:anti-sigma B factor antagonist
MLEIEKNEQYALINVTGSVFDDETAEQVTKKVSGLYREGYHNYILNIAETTSIDTAGLLTIKKIEKLSKTEQGIFVICSQNDAIIEELDDLKIDELVILPTVEEAKEAIYIHELESEFRSEDGEDENEYGEDSDNSYSDYE